MSNDITAPGRSALWTQAALAAIQGFAANSGGLVDMAAIAERAMTTADTFERRCIERHAREQAANATLANLPAVTPDALPTVPGMAESDARMRAEMAERGGETAG